MKSKQNSIKKFGLTAIALAVISINQAWADTQNTVNQNTSTTEVANEVTNKSINKELIEQSIEQNADDLNRYQKAYQDEYRDSKDDTWVDNKRDTTKDWLNDKADSMNNWFGDSNPDKPASAKLRFMVDYRHNKYDGDTIKPRIRGSVRLPALEQRLSLMIGDDELDDERYDVGRQIEGRANPNGKTFDRKQSREDNASLALRWSKLQKKSGIDTDADIGIRSDDDLYLKLRAQKIWEQGDDVSIRLEQIYRYGIDSKHYLRTNLQVNKDLSASRYLSNHTYLDYRSNDTEELYWGNSLYQHHTFDGKLGDKTLSYGIHTSGEIDDGNASLDTYGPYITYRQPIWRQWLFAQGELSYYNHKPTNKDHHLGTFLRLEAVF